MAERLQLARSAQKIKADIENNRADVENNRADVEKNRAEENRLMQKNFEGIDNLLSQAMEAMAKMADSKPAPATGDHGTSHGGNFPEEVTVEENSNAAQLDVGGTSSPKKSPFQKLVQILSPRKRAKDNGTATVQTR